MLHRTTHDCHVCAASTSVASRRAFTLLELLVVMGIIALLTSIAVVSVVPFLSGRALSTGASAVQFMVYQARTHAVCNSMPATLAFSATDRSMILYDLKPDELEGLTDQQRKARRVSRPEYLPTGVVFVDTDGDVVTQEDSHRATLVFYCDGSLDRAEMSTGNWQIRLGEDEAASQKVITVIFASGLPKVEDE